MGDLCLQPRTAEGLVSYFLLELWPLVSGWRLEEVTVPAMPQILPLGFIPMWGLGFDFC